MRKHVILTTLFLVLSTTIFAQTINEAGEKFNSANAQYSEKNYAGALKLYNEALAITKALGDDGFQLGTNIETMIPKTKEALAKAYINDKNIDEALKYLLEAIKDADNVADTKTAASCKGLACNIYLAKAGSAYGQKNWDDAISLSNLAIEYNKSTPKAYLFKALAYSDKKDEANMTAAIMDAVTYGEARNDPKTVSSARQVGTTYFNNQAQAFIGKSNFNDAVKSLNKSIEIDNKVENTWYLKASCLNKLNKTDEAIEAGLEGLKIESENKDIRNGINLELARAYEAKGDNANACTYYKQAATSATFKEEATFKTTELKCK